MSWADLTASLYTHPGGLALAVFLIAAMESLFLVGLLLPGVALLFPAAVLAGQGALELWILLLAGGSGAALGDGLSFVLGQHGQALLARWPLNRYGDLLDRGKVFFIRHGALSIALGRFVGPIRPVIPTVAGLLGMPGTTFYAVNLLSAALWAPVYLLPGYWVGRFGSRHDSLYSTAGLVVAAIAFVLTVWLTVRRQQARIQGFFGKLSMLGMAMAACLILLLLPG